MPGSATEYRQSFLSPRREDYIPQVALPKIGPNRPPSNRAFLSIDLDPNNTSQSSEYRLCYENYHPKRPYCFHAQPSHVFDYVPKPLERKTSSRLLITKDTEYNERYPNYPSFIPTHELVPPHMSGKTNTQSETHRKREHMSRSQYFQQLIQDNEKLTGGQRIVGTSEQRNAFQWPYHYPPHPSSAKPIQRMEMPANVYQSYNATPKNIYEPLPPIQRPVINTTN